MALPKTASLGTGLAVAGLVVAIHFNATPSVADIRVGGPGDADIAGAERAATWQAAMLVSAISLLAKDPTIFVVGGGVTVAMAWLTRHADLVDPLTGRAASNAGSRSAMVDPDDLGDDPAAVGLVAVPA